MENIIACLANGAVREVFVEQIIVMQFCGSHEKQVRKKIVDTPQRSNLNNLFYFYSFMTRWLAFARSPF